MLPGETAYVVLRPDAEERADVAQGRAVPSGPEAPWYSQLWGSVQAADRS